MTILKPSIGRGPCWRKPGPCFYPTVALIPDAPSDYVEDLIGFSTIEQALDELENELRLDFKPGDEIHWAGSVYSAVDEAMAAIRANPVTVRWL